MKLIKVSIVIAVIFIFTSCEEFEEFRTFFTSAFGKLMLNKSYAGIIARQIKDKELNLPFLNQPISAIFRPNIVTCPYNATIHVAVQKMVKSNSCMHWRKNLPITSGLALRSLSLPILRNTGRLKREN